MENGTELGLKEMFGEDWDLIGTSGDKKQFGMEVKDEVNNRVINNLVWIRIENSGRFDVYKKI